MEQSLKELVTDVLGEYTPVEAGTVEYVGADEVTYTRTVYQYDVSWITGAVVLVVSLIGCFSMFKSFVRGLF